MTEEYPVDVRKEACWVITNLVTTAENIDFKMMVAAYDDYKVLALFTKCLKNIDLKLTLQIVEALDHLFQLDRCYDLPQVKTVLYQFELAGGIDVIEDLQQNPNEQIQKAVDKLVSEYMDENKTMETENTQQQ